MRRGKTPPTYIAYRVTAVTIMVLVVLLFWMGLRGHGPLHSLGPITSNLVGWVRVNTGVNLR
jgi:hypothetical protein